MAYALPNLLTCRMDSTVLCLLIEFIRKAWLEVAIDSRPWLVYVSAVIPQTGSPDKCLWVHGEVISAWRFDERGIVPVRVWDYERFASLHFNPLWNSARIAPSAIFGPRTHEIGIATLCEFPDTKEYYVDYHWGGRYGRGFAVTVEGHCIKSVRELWRS